MPVYRTEAIPGKFKMKKNNNSKITRLETISSFVSALAQTGNFATDKRLLEVRTTKTHLPK